jgi:hypothetical protein
MVENIALRRIFEPTKQQMAEGWRKFNNEEHHKVLLRRLILIG